MRAEGNLHVAAIGSQEIAFVGGVERTVERPGPFGPIRASQRHFVAESAEALGLDDSLRDAQAQYARVADELRAFAEAASEREAWWRRNVETMELGISDRDAQRNRLLEIAESGWVERHAEMRVTADEASRSIAAHAEAVEVQSVRLRQVENHAEREYASLRTGMADAQRDQLALREQLVLAQSAESLTSARR